jgi:hypothetical protein
MTDNVTKKQTYGKYSFESITDNNNRYLVRVFNNNAKKAYNRQVAYYSFGTDENRRDEYIQNFMSNVKTREEAKAQRKAERKAFVNPAKIGDILECSWGYDQTNVDYYQVTKVLGKMVEIRPIAGQHVEGSGYSHGMADSVKPVQNAFIEKHWSGKDVLRKLVKASSYKDYCVSIASYANAYKVDENSTTYRSWYA